MSTFIVSLFVLLRKKNFSLEIKICLAKQFLSENQNNSAILKTTSVAKTSVVDYFAIEWLLSYTMSGVLSGWRRSSALEAFFSGGCILQWWRRSSGAGKFFSSYRHSSTGIHSSAVRSVFQLLNAFFSCSSSATGGIFSLWRSFNLEVFSRDWSWRHFQRL